MKENLFPTIRKQPINNLITSNKFLNDDTKIPLIKLTTSDFPDFWCYGNYIYQFDKTIQRELRKTTWNSDAEDCFIDFGDDDRGINKKKEIVNYSEDKPLFFNLYRLELIVIGEVSDELTEKLYVADSQKLNYLVKLFLREIPLDFPYDWSRDDRRESLKKKGDHSDNIYSFLQFHFDYFDGYKEDFIHNLVEITNDIWKGRTRDNKFRRELLNEWIEEKIEEHDLDRSKIGLKTLTTPEPPQLQNEETGDLKDGDLWDKLALIHYLNKYKLLKLDTLHQDNTKIASVLSFLIGKSSESIRQKLSTVRKNDFKPSLKNLESILPIVKFLDHKEMIEEIETVIKKQS